MNGVLSFTRGKYSSIVTRTERKMKVSTTWMPIDLDT